MYFRLSSSLNIERKTKRHVLLLLFVLTPVHLNWPSYATGKCYRSPLQLISTMKQCWLYVIIHSLTIFKWKMRYLRLNLIYLSFFVQYIIWNALILKNGNRWYKYLVLGHEETYFVNELQSYSKNKYTEDDIIKMLEFLVDNIFVVLPKKSSSKQLAYQWVRIVPLFSRTSFYIHTKRNSFKNWMLILVLLCENECQRWDASRYIHKSARFYVYRDASHLWHSFSHNRTKINIQNL